MVANRNIVFPGPPAEPLKIPESRNQDLKWVSDWIRNYNTKPYAENPSGYARISEEFAFVDALIKQGRRVYLGEFGAIEFADAQSRENYVRLIRQEAERRNVAWCYWDDNGPFKMIDLEKGDVVSLRKALLDRP